MMRRFKLVALFGLVLLTVGAPAPVAGQSSAAYVPDVARGQDFELSVRNIMRGPELLGQAPGQIRWTDDSAWLYFRWRPGGLDWDEQSSLYRVPADGGAPEKLDDDVEYEAAVLIAGGDLSQDRRWRVSTVRGDIYLVDRRAMTTRRLTHTQDGEGSALFSEDGESVLFQRGGNVYRLTLESGELEQITRVSTSPASDEEKEAEGQRGFLETQQLELFEHISRQAEREKEADARRETREAFEPKTVHLEARERLQSLRPTRDGNYVLSRASKPAQGAQRTIVPDWVTESGYTEDLNVRTKVGDAQNGGRAGIITTASGEVTWLDVKPEGYEGEGQIRVSNAGWNDAGTKAFVFAVSFDDKDRWLWSVDAATGERTLLDHLHDEAWVAGPCFSCVGWIPDEDRVYFVSEATGYAHLYVVNSDGSNREALTSGEWEVLGITMPEDRSRFLLTTNEGSPFNQHVSWMGFDGDSEAITEGDGRFRATLSPDGDRFAFIHDVANRPGELFLAETGRPTEMERVTTSPTEAWASFDWKKPEIVRFEAEDGAMVPARIYRPAEMGAQANGAAVIFVHGSGYTQNVHNYFSSYYREYMFNHLLAAAGYTVLDVDYRGSAGYGRDWRTGIYRWMGGKDLSDQVDGARYLVEAEGVDADRIGLYGGSYGGFITLMGLFTADETFKSGAALRPVTDWAHYNHGYTSRILNQPQGDEEAYRQSSPIYFAEGFGLDQHLVILHGMVDTNVHFSDAVRLTQRLIELGKENWEMAVYPVENHGFVEPTSWTDEYRRIFELFERTLREPGCTENGAFCSVRTGGLLSQ
ncbi:MAG: prolyl oligopeptidase family serine peptidase [Gemmatimonadota bacterium]|nr:prolyl oligopeptidase family serine peptidase [Gemmatimonadota bacterium]